MSNEKLKHPRKEITKKTLEVGTNKKSKHFLNEFFFLTKLNYLLLQSEGSIRKRIRKRKSQR